MTLTPYWIEFEREAGQHLPLGLALGCGVTAESTDDAMLIAKSKLAVYFDNNIPKTISINKIYDTSILDANHVLPNMGNILARGMWFPRIP